LFGSDESGQEQHPGINMEQIMEIAKKFLSGKKKKRPVIEWEAGEGEGINSAIARQLRRK
jgi:hypothetical protein